MLGCMASVLLREAILSVSFFSLDFRSLVVLTKMPIFWISIACYCVSFLIWMRLLVLAPLGLIYPVLLTTTFLIMALISIIFLREPIGIRQIMGMALALAGILLLIWPRGIS